MLCTIKEALRWGIVIKSKSIMQGWQETIGLLFKMEALGISANS